jgi:hypothetical protein
MKLHIDYPSDKIPDTEHSEPFIRGMVDRMLVSFFKYGKVADAYPGKVSALESLQARIAKYRQTGNTEYLIDAANFAMIEFMHPSQADAHFTPTDSDGSPGRVWSGGIVSAAPNVERHTYARDGD